MPAKPGLTLQRRFKAPPSKVYQAWTDPQQMMQWFGPTGATVLEVQADPHVGGRFRVVMTGPDGERHEVNGIYREVVTDRKLCFTWAWHSTPERESLVTLTFRAEHDARATLFTLTHEQFFDEDARDRHREGWNGSFDRLAILVESFERKQA